MGIFTNRWKFWKYNKTDDKNTPFDLDLALNNNWDKLEAEGNATFQGNRNINLPGGGQLQWGVTANVFSWSKEMRILPAGGKLLPGGVALTNIKIALGSVTLANAWDCMYITIPTTDGATVVPAVAQYNAITGDDKLILAVRDTDSCLELFAGGWLVYGTTVAVGGKRDNYLDKTIFMALNDFIVGTGAGTYAKKTLAETKTILGINNATSGATGVIQLATSAEVTTGTDTAKAVTPATLKVELDKKLDDTQLSTDFTFAGNSDILIPSQKATKTYVDTQVANLVNSSPDALDTLNELAEALANDPNFAVTMTNALAGKIDKSAFTAVGDILIGTGEGTYIKKTLAEIRDMIIAPGTTMYVNSIYPLSGFIKKNGVLLSRTTYANLWAYAQATGNIVDESTWQAGAWGSFSTGDGINTFRIPDDRGYGDRAWDDGRGIDSGRAIGSSQADDTKSHSHLATSASAGAHAHSGTTSTTGAHTHPAPQIGDRSGTRANTSGDGGGSHIVYNPSTGSAGDHAHTFSTNSAGDHAHTITVNATGGTETRMKNIAKLAIIKY